MTSLVTQMLLIVWLMICIKYLLKPNDYRLLMIPATSTQLWTVVLLIDLSFLSEIESDKDCFLGIFPYPSSRLIKYLDLVFLNWDLKKAKKTKTWIVQERRNQACCLASE